MTPFYSVRVTADGYQVGVTTDGRDCPTCHGRRSRDSRTCRPCYFRRRREVAERQARVRFDASIQPRHDGCWMWTGQVGSHGYGTLSVNKKAHLAHRLSYEFHKGPIPTGLAIDHLCRNRRCVNPDHLEAVTQTENNRRTRLLICGRGHSDWRVKPTGRRYCKPCNDTSNAGRYR